MILQLKIVPNARKNELISEASGIIKVKIKSPPVDGKANEELVSFLSEKLKVPKSFIEIISGNKGRLKKIKIIGDENTLKLKLFTSNT